jgi:hypothetical protein
MLALRPPGLSKSVENHHSTKKSSVYPVHFMARAFFWKLVNLKFVNPLGSITSFRQLGRSHGEHQTLGKKDILMCQAKNILSMPRLDVCYCDSVKNDLLTYQTEVS